MRKLISRVVFCLMVTVLIWTVTLIRDRKILNEELIRFHVVANSDSQEDQALKLQVRDAVLQSIQEDLAQVADVNQAKAYLRENLPKIQSTANAVLEQAGFQGEAVVNLCREAFDTRYYDTFTLPAGIYESLRVTIGEGEGHNWWCVSFPTLCLPASSEGFEEAAVEAGFTDTLSHTLSVEQDYEIRFFFLDCLGRIQNSLFQRGGDCT